MAEVTISAKNQIVIPREPRQALGVKDGNKLLPVAEGDRVIVLKKAEGLSQGYLRHRQRGIPLEFVTTEN
jgi:AbrB family looped-hinge helix DNA binding protein